MALEVWDRKDNKPKKSRKEGIPTSGNKGPLLGKILACYMFMREERSNNTSREINNSPTFTPDEDGLLEVLTDPSIYPSIKFAFQSGKRADIDLVGLKLHGTP